MRLRSYSEIDNVLYWDRDGTSPIDKWVTENIIKCDIFLLICSRNIEGSQPVQNECHAAQKLHKLIIPIFKDINDIPLVLHSYRGVQFQDNDLDKTVNEIYQLILRSISNIDKESQKNIKNTM